MAWTTARCRCCVATWTIRSSAADCVAEVALPIVPHPRPTMARSSAGWVLSRREDPVIRSPERGSRQSDSFFGLAIGFTVVAGAFAVGGISGGAFNPAVSLGAAAVGLLAWSTLWGYIVVQAIAGIARRPRIPCSIRTTSDPDG